ncbi:hypothetical protein ACEV7Y_13765 [Vibrio parahaemolyticus]|uniref:hypothetical protein n=1 Tax=Vibrio parahaemolyticus TaxID=670 RepID=UPI0003FE1318|nr:hypothetical protein [Vibrio parahaemolyticus]EIU6866815.1 hypothetical protein [Vibrio parahaemolyticus]MCG6432060.1 hypothetical protein [Vibrio parahaemolyticus]TNZ94423.1 hypothetical protein CGK37_07350 [Vibrio parahaemolyticus]TOA13405.1 hypothetical protein CGK34_11825 [Vibrio parahaemolyticus]TOA15493.1 hypothetical protein CGK34_07130 [Vibrio parahaemolyticus]
MRNAYTKLMIQKSKLLLESRPELFEQYVAFAKELEGSGDKNIVAGLLQYFYEQDLLRPELILEERSPFAAQMLFSFEQYDLFKAMLMEYQDHEQIGLYLADNDFELPDWVFDSLNQSVPLNPQRMAEIKQNYPANQVVIGSSVDVPKGFYFGNKILASFNGETLPDVAFDVLEESKGANEILSLDVLRELQCSSTISTADNGTMIKEYNELKQQKEWLTDHLELNNDTTLRESVYYHNGKPKPLASSLTENGVLLGKSPSVDELINSFLVVKDKHIHSFPYQELSLENLRMALEIINQDALFDLEKITVGEKVDQRIKLVVQQVFFPEKVLVQTQNNPFEGVELEVDQPLLSDEPDYEEQIIAELRREVQEGLFEEPAIAKRKVKRSKGLRL